MRLTSYEFRGRKSPIYTARELCDGVAEGTLTVAVERDGWGDYGSLLVNGEPFYLARDDEHAYRIADPANAHVYLFACAIDLSAADRRTLGIEED